ncbi:hypothetical protein NP493_558g01049 [Ridgeia piscesae]|uniref:SH3 domain-containing protein n=1 Tax=Ridgeia piscesae TaxID=27915 RepID=A0AAD9NPZ9_RIDPI|nr:hypothetical protein NP493_558g01049 [Ridgeia piscesae]
MRSVQKEGDVLKKKVDKFIKEAQGKFPKFEKGKLSKKDITSLHSRCLREKTTVEELLDKADKLEERDEPEKVAEFDQRKRDEINRLQHLKTELEKIADKLMPPDEEEMARKEEEEKAKAAAKEQEETEDEDEYETDDDEEVTDEEETEDEAVVGKNKKPERDIRRAKEEEEEEEEDEEETDESEEETETVDNYHVQAVGDFAGEQKGDLGFKEGEVLTILSAREDGWLHAMNEQGDRGLVPSTYVRNCKDEEDEEVDETGDDEEEEEEDEEDGDEPVSPSSKKHFTKSGKNLWSTVRETVKETSVTDVLQAMGAVPAGFRVSTLAKLQQHGQHSLKGYLTPKLSASNVGYRDLFINHNTNRIRSIPVTTQRIVTLVNVRQMPLPGAGIDVTSRHVRICLFDGTNVLSNMHTIKVATVDKDEKTWNFNRKISDIMRSLEYGECFIRTNTSHTNLGILFELAVSYVRTTTGQAGEFSCGWVHLPLFDQDPKPVPNKTYDMTLSMVCNQWVVSMTYDVTLSMVCNQTYDVTLSMVCNQCVVSRTYDVALSMVCNQTYDMTLNGGTPYERGVLVDPILGRRTEGSLLKSLMASNRQPHLTIRMAAPTKAQKELLDTLPEVLVSSTSYILYMSMYREILTDALLRDRNELQSVEPIHSPVLALFPDVAMIPDLMDVLRMGWAETQKVIKRADKKDPEALKELFRRVFMDYVFPLLSCASLPEFDMTRPEILQERQTEISHMVEINKAASGPGGSLVSANIAQTPFNISELTFTPIGPHCVARVY